MKFFKWPWRKIKLSNIKEERISLTGTPLSSRRYLKKFLHGLDERVYDDSVAFYREEIDTVDACLVFEQRGSDIEPDWCTKKSKNPTITIDKFIKKYTRHIDLKYYF